MRYQGKIKTWNKERGFGFIAPAQGGPEIFVHISALSKNFNSPTIGLSLTYELDLQQNSKPRAIKIRAQHGASQTRPRQPNSSKRHSAPAAQSGLLGASAIPLFIALYLLLNLQWPISPWWALSYLLLSLASLLIYAIDKAAAKAGRRRIPENSLHLLALLGGWPGALIAQQWLRHKSSKLAFRIVFWFSVGLNIVLFLLLTTPLLAVLIG
ncbi:DUF1294 domain-containing protein [Undibacterium sp. Ren11W]|uniref:DUF1294 domain-containing protein n=1 Tax=Undibacterium sp. Ren11W TaxID=3413045 RepID=UPI003BF28360